METRVVIEQRTVPGLDHAHNPQRVATVFFGIDEFVLYLPAKATGDPRQWKEQMLVYQSRWSGEGDVTADTRARVISAVCSELDKPLTATLVALADDYYCNAQICLNGDVQSSDGTPFDNTKHCIKCGATCIHICPSCKALIRGKPQFSAAEYDFPNFCHACGKPYPWMADKLDTAKQLLFHDDKLAHEDRTNLYNLLSYVMSNPKAELAPAKSALIRIQIQKATAPIREFVLDLLAKYAVEASK